MLFILEHTGSTHQDLARFRRDRSKHGRKKTEKTLNHCLNVFIKDCLAMKRTKTCSLNPWTATLILRLSYEEGRSRCDSFLLSKWVVFCEMFYKNLVKCPVRVCLPQKSACKLWKSVTFSWTIVCQSNSASFVQHPLQSGLCLGALQKPRAGLIKWEWQNFFSLF